MFCLVLNLGLYHLLVRIGVAGLGLQVLIMDRNTLGLSRKLLVGQISCINTIEVGLAMELKLGIS